MKELSVNQMGHINGGGLLSCIGGIGAGFLIGGVVGGVIGGVLGCAGDLG